VIDKTTLGTELSVRLMRVPKIETILPDLESKGLSVGLGKSSLDQTQSIPGKACRLEGAA
jgi:hypothetical protein